MLYPGQLNAEGEMSDPSNRRAGFVRELRARVSVALQVGHWRMGGVVGNGEDARSTGGKKASFQPRCLSRPGPWTSAAFFESANLGLARAAKKGRKPRRELHPRTI